MGALVMFDGRDTHDSNVKVVCRVRPLNEREASSGAHAAVVVRSDRVVSVSGSRLGKQYTQRFEFDRALDGRVQQPQFFEGSGVRRMLDAALEGYGATIFAYGQTGSGKTHTMFGSSVSGGTDGIIPRAIEYLYLRARQLSGTAGEMVGVGGGGGARCSLRSSFCEIYNEQVYDLLNPQASPGHDGRMLPRSLHVRQSDSSGFLVQDLFVVACEDTEDMTAVVAEGVANRHVSNHAMNKDSSRSHALFTIEIDVEGGGRPARRGKVCFVDLAGSERLRDTHSTGQVLKEAGFINSSLFVLGKVISALSTVGVPADGASTHQTAGATVPFRDSKLTMLLKDCLGGRSLALMVACVSPATSYADESVATLSYAT